MKRLLDGLVALTGLTKAFGDVLSYLRLFALGLASASLALAFNDLAHQVGTISGFGMLLALVILMKAERGKESRLPGKIWAGLILGSLILIFGFILDYSQHMLTHFSLLEMMEFKNPEVLVVATSYVPQRFPWAIFAAGELTILACIAWYSLLKV